MTKSYCTQNNGDCSTCSLVNYGMDCNNVSIKNPAAVALGKLGGSAKTEAKARASRENGKKGGRKKNQTEKGAG